MKPLVSICIPNYNYERFIGETIESVLKQTYNNYEVIICDNCSTDRSLEIINSYSDSRIKVYRNSENINLYENINKAISYSCGELIAILHSDDLYAPDFLEKIVQAYTHNPEQRVFVTGVYNYHDETKLALPHHPFKTGGIKPKLEVLIRLQQKNNIGNGVNVILHQECIAKAGMYSSNFRYASDYDLWLRLAEYFDFYYIPEILAYYRIHSSNLSHKVNKNLEMWNEGLEIRRINLQRTEVIPQEMIPDLRWISSRAIVQKSIELGLRYQSGELMRNMLQVAYNYNPELLDYSFAKLLNKLSVHIDKNPSPNNIKLFKYIFRLLFYPNKKWLEYSIEKTVNNALKQQNYASKVRNKNLYSTQDKVSG